jgi:carbon storage regulator
MWGRFFFDPNGFRLVSHPGIETKLKIFTSSGTKCVQNPTPLQGGAFMLVLTRRLGEEIIINGNIRLKVVAVKGDRIRLGIDAPPSVVIDRQEIHERRQHASDSATKPCCVIKSVQRDSK